MSTTSRPSTRPHPTAQPGLDQTSRSAAIALERVTVSYGDAAVLTDLDLHVPNRGLMVLVGPSGCGKSTCLRVLAGLQAPSHGRVRLGGDDITHQPARDRGVAMVFQNFALYPHMTVTDNISFGLRLEAKHQRGRGGLDGAEIARRVDAVVDMLDLHGLERRRPAALSGGQQQRVALARAIVREPRVFLMDEPLSNLDAQLRSQTRQEIQRLHQRLQATMLYVTHDQIEALTMATTLAVMNHGRIEQVGTPEAVYDSPRTTFVAGFIGSPQMNLLAWDGGVIGWRPGRSQLSPVDADRATTPSMQLGQSLRLLGRVETVELLGDDELIGMTGPWGQATGLRRRGSQLDIGAPLQLEVPQDGLHRFDADGRRLGS